MKKLPKNTNALERVVALPCSSFSKTALHIDPKATEKELGELGSALVEIEGSRSWWLGDYGLELQRRRLDQLKKGTDSVAPVTDAEELSVKGAHYINGKAEALGIDIGTWRNYVMVARFFKPSYRNDASSFAHHIVAMYAVGAAGDPKKAVAWLLKAQENGWSVSKMREAVNKSLATNPPPQLPPEENIFAPLDEADKWAHNMTTQKINPEAARQLLTRWSELLAFIEKLKELAK